MIARRGLGVEVVEYILTVPAVWSDKARSQMVDAARRAGMERVGLVGEPEAAAEYALRSVEGVRVGECFVVCDAGGGTVDLISYGVLGVDPLRVGEVAVGTGALGGAVYLDRRFEELLERRVGAGVVAGMAPQARAQMFEYWEHSIKRPFSGPTGEDYFLPMMGTISAGVEGGFLRITRQEVTSIFTPIISQILSLIKAQASSSPSTPRSILLVGGLGSNEHLYTHLTAWSTAHSITILQPPDAWTAVVRGAILRALRGTTVSAHMSRQSYGIVHSARWDPNAHPVSSREWHSLRNEWVVRDLMQWYIHRGDISTPATVLSFPFYRTLKESEVTGPTHVLRTELWVCDSPSSPPALRDASVRKLCVMKSAPVPVERFIKTRNAAGKVFYRVDYSLDMAVVGGVVVYEMSMAGKGKGKEKGERVKVGRVEVEYE